MTFDQAIDKLIQGIREAPDIIGTTAVTFYQDSFTKQGWDGETFEPWPERKKEDKKNPSRPILILNSHLRNDILKKTANDQEVIVGTGGQVPYARIHNEGGVIRQAARSETFQRQRFVRGSKRGKFKSGTRPGKGFTFKAREIHIPKRQFMGISPKLNKEILQNIVNNMKNKLK